MLPSVRRHLEMHPGSSRRYDRRHQGRAGEPLGTERRYCADNQKAKLIKSRRKEKMTKKKEQVQVISQASLADGIFSMWIRTEAAKSARPGQFISMYTSDGTKLLPRPISICEIDKEKSALRVVYRVTGEHTGTEQFSRMQAGEQLSIIGPLGNGFPLERAKGKRVFLMGGGIGVPPILELAKQMSCEKKQIIVGYRDRQTFLKEEFEACGEVYISTEDGSVETRGNVMNVVEEKALEADVIYAAAPHLC